jgi:hypothetical protein
LLPDVTATGLAFEPEEWSDDVEVVQGLSRLGIHHPFTFASRTRAEVEEASGQLGHQVWHEARLIKGTPDFDWGVLNGQVAALRWALGDENLDP